MNSYALASKEVTIQCLKKIIEMIENDHNYKGGMVFFQPSETSLAFNAEVVFSIIPLEQMQ